MATNKINVVEKTPGTHIEYALSGGKKITFGDDELTINLASRERDFEVSLDICIDEEDGVVIGTGGRAQKYAAQIVIPARRYDVIESVQDMGRNTMTSTQPEPLAIKRMEVQAI